MLLEQMTSETHTNALKVVEWISSDNGHFTMDNKGINFPLKLLLLMVGLCSSNLKLFKDSSTDLVYRTIRGIDLNGTRVSSPLMCLTRRMTSRHFQKDLIACKDVMVRGHFQCLCKHVRDSTGDTRCEIL